MIDQVQKGVRGLGAQYPAGLGAVRLEQAFRGSVDDVDGMEERVGVASQSLRLRVQFVDFRGEVIHLAIGKGTLEDQVAVLVPTPPLFRGHTSK